MDSEKDIVERLRAMSVSVFWFQQRHLGEQLPIIRAAAELLEKQAAEIERLRRTAPAERGDSSLSPRDAPSDEHLTHVPIRTPPALVEWKRVVNDAYLLLCDPRCDAVWQSGVNEWLQRALSLATRATGADTRGEANPSLSPTPST